MSRSHPELIVEINGAGLRIFDPTRQVTETFASFAEASTKFRGRRSVLALDRRSVFIKTARLPDSSRDNLRQALSLQVGAMFPSANGPVAFDVRPTDDLNSEGRLAQIAAVPSPQLQTVFAEATDAGFQILHAVPVALSSQILAHRAQMRDATVIQRLGDEVAIDVVQDGFLRYSRVVPIESDLEAEIRRTEMAAKCGALPRLTVGGISLTDAVPSGTTALEAVSDDNAPLVLEPRERAEARDRRSVRSAKSLSLLLALAAGTLALGVYMDRSDAAAAVAKKEGRMNVAVRQLTSIQASVESDVVKEAKRRDVLERAFSPGQALSDVVATVSLCVPKDCWVTALSLDRGKPLTIRGTAKTSAAVTAFLDNLNAQSRLRDVRLVFANNTMIEEIPVVQFSVSAFPVGNVPLVEVSKRRKA